MAWTTSARVDNLLGSTTLRQRLFALDGTYASGVFDQYEAEARAQIVSVLLYAGYSDPGSTLTSGSTTEGFLAGICEAIMIRDAFAQAKGIQWPAGLRDRIESKANMLSQIYERRLPVPGLTPSTSAGYGGVDFSETDPDVSTSARPQRFSRSELKSW